MAPIRIMKNSTTGSYEIVNLMTGMRIWEDGNGALVVQQPNGDVTLYKGNFLALIEDFIEQGVCQQRSGLPDGLTVYPEGYQHAARSEG